MNRRTFLQSIIGAAITAAIPIPFPQYDDGAEIYALRKALSMGPAGLVGGSALQIEDLSATLKLVTFDDTHIKLWKNLHV